MNGNKEIKLCKDCRNFDGDTLLDFGRCRRKITTNSVSLVTGKLYSAKLLEDALLERDDARPGHCGPDAKFWERKITFKDILEALFG